MGERLAGGNVAIALLGNTIPTGAILVVLITMLGPISGAHLRPVCHLTVAFFLERQGLDAVAKASPQSSGRPWQHSSVR
jgi:glycerol uptake facilitator-like aquaporin